MDEPLASLDEQTKMMVQEDLLRMWEGSRRTVIFITHSLDEAIVLGDRVAVMSFPARPHQGRLRYPPAPPARRAGTTQRPSFHRGAGPGLDSPREEVLSAHAAEAARRAT